MLTMENQENITKNTGPILHVIVVGFHHKKGCQVEYSFPPLLEGDPHACPAGWKYLPTLALPDGSHNFDEDTVFFHLPSLTDPKQTVYGISCFRQIPVEKLKNRTADITRGTVQKSVCVLSTLPLYGHIQVKMALITHAYFDEGDFSKVKLLHDTYHHLNSCLSETDFLHASAPQLYVGLSVRDLVLQFRHKALILFKLLLLERRLVFYRSPVQPLCATILSLLSLHPGMIERGLKESACVRPSRPMSPIPEFTDSSVENKKVNGALSSSSEDSKESVKQDSVTSTDSAKKDCPQEVSKCSVGKKTASKCSAKEAKCSQEDKRKIEKPSKAESSTSASLQGGNVSAGTPVEENWLEVSATCDGKLHGSDSINSIATVGGNESQKDHVLPRDSSIDTIGETNVQNNMAAIAQMNAELCGLPLPLFTQGYLCHPYLSLPYLDLLADVNVRGYLVGATNVLFKQKKQLVDVLVEVEGAKLETQDLELRRQLHLTTEDLRFADFLVRHVSDEHHDIFLDGVGWEGGDEWIRAQFRVYLLCLLRTSLLQEGSREIEHFNANFMTAWKSTNNYKMWLSNDHTGIWDLNPGHPFAGQLSVADMKLRLAHTMQNTEGGRKLNQAMASTGRAVATTGRAVGGAISQARGALSSWWSTLTTAQSPEAEMAEDASATIKQDNSVCRPASLIEQELESNRHKGLNGNIAGMATQQLPKGIDCLPASKAAENSSRKTDVPQAESVPLKLTGGAGGDCEEDATG